MTSGEVANQLSVSVGTVRRWARVFDKFLSPDANPPKGEVRRFTEDDLRVLAAIAYYSKEEHLKHDDIHEKLSAGDHEVEAIPMLSALRGETEPAAPSEASSASWSIWVVELDSLLRQTRGLINAERSARRAITQQIDALKQQVDGLEPYLGAPGQIQELQTAVEEIRQVLPALGVQQSALEQRLRALQGESASREQVHSLRQALGQLRDALEHQVDEQTALRQRIDLLQSALPSTQQVAEVQRATAQLQERAQEHRQLVAGVQQQIDSLELALASREQVAALQDLVEELRQLADQNMEDGAIRLQQIIRLEQQVEHLQTALVEQGTQGGLGRLYHAFNYGIGELTARAISWVLLLVAALAVLYYLELTVVPTVLLAVGIALALWLIGGRFVGA